MPAFDRCDVRPLTAADLEMVLAWRNHPDIRRCMLTQHEISLEEHRAWFERAREDSSRCLLVAEERGTPFGFVHFSGVRAAGVADWGFYAAPGAPKGAGTKLGASALDVAFRELQLHKVCGQALDFNEASIRMHTRLGFTQEGVLRDQHRIGGKHHDLFCYGLLRREWL